MVADYIPDRGDIIWIDFGPGTGHEQTGKRPAIVLSALSYHKRSSLLIACPITSKTKGYPFEVPIKVGKIDGTILVDQVKALDWHNRKIGYGGKTKPMTTKRASALLRVLIGS